MDQETKSGLIQCVHDSFIVCSRRWNDIVAKVDQLNGMATTESFEPLLHTYFTAVIRLQNKLVTSSRAVDRIMKHAKQYQLKK